MDYKELYVKAAKAITNETFTEFYYKGYTGANALSLYVDEKHSVNAAAIPAAHDALCEVMSTSEERFLFGRP